MHLEPGFALVLRNCPSAAHRLVVHWLQVVDPNRRFVHEGDVDVWPFTSSAYSPAHAFLFNDCLLYARKRRGMYIEWGSFAFFQKQQIVLEETREGEGLVFVLRSETEALGIRCSSPETKSLWIEHLKRCIYDSRRGNILAPQS